MNVVGRFDNWRRRRTTQRIADEGTDPKRWQRHTGDAAISVTPHTILEPESNLHSYSRTTLR
jgi:hypothetical protein